MDTSLFRISNKHVAASGTPPEFDGNTPGRYHSYFENAQGEQLIFIYDRQTDSATLYHGDLGWDRPRPVCGKSIYVGKPCSYHLPRTAKVVKKTIWAKNPLQTREGT